MQDATQTPLDSLTLDALSECFADRVAAAVVAQVGQALREGREMRKAWVGQDPKQVKKHGSEAASWYVNFIDPDGHRRTKSYGPGGAGKEMAERECRKVTEQLLTGTYQTNLGKPWAAFRAKYEADVLAGRSAACRRQVKMSLDNFERICAPKKVSAIRTETIDTFAARRREEENQRVKGRTVSPATVNADLHNLKAVLGVAKRWGYLAQAPEIPFLREPRKLPVYVTPDHFAAMYLACDRMRRPRVQGCAPGDWWRALLVFIYVGTGWRIGQCLGLERPDLDLEAGTVVGRAACRGNKARADVLVKLHPVVLEHVSRLRGFAARAFPYPHCERTLLDQLHALCRLAGVPAYGWHNLRKGFGTMNAPRLAPTELQHLMQHSSLGTTQRYYVNAMAGQDEAVAKLHVPEVLLRGAG